MTCTSLAHCPETGQLGLGVVSSLMAVTARCCFVRAQVGSGPLVAPARLGRVLTQGWFLPMAVAASSGAYLFYAQHNYPGVQVALAGCCGSH